MAKIIDEILGKSRCPKCFDLIDRTVVIYRLDTCGLPESIIGANREAARRLGYEADELTDTNLKRLLRPEYVESLREKFENFVDEKYHEFDLVLISKKGIDIPMTFNSELIMTGEEKALLCVEKAHGMADNEFDRRRRQVLEDTISEIYMKFMTLYNDDSDTSESLGRLGSVMGLSRVYTFLYNKGKTTMSCANEWYAEGLAPALNGARNLPCSHYHWLIKELNNGTFVRLSELPTEAIGERKLFMSRDLKSTLMLPLQINSDIVGFVGFASTGEISGEDLFFLRIFSGILGYAFRAKQVNDEYELKNDRLHNQKKVPATLTSTCFDYDIGLKEIFNEIVRATTVTLNLKYTGIILLDNVNSRVKFGSLFNNSLKYDSITQPRRFGMEYLSEIFLKDQINILKKEEIQNLFPMME